MKKYIITFLTLTFCLSCTNDFDELNKNPLAANSVPTTALLTTSLQGLININSGLGFNKTLMLYSQQWAQRETTNRSLYDLGNTSGSWSSWYGGALPEVNEIIALNSGSEKEKYATYGSNANQIAVARILRAWAFHTMTDTWGDIPYFEAFNAKEIVSPKYDKQESIYIDLIKELKEVDKQIDVNSSGFKSGDLLYNGDMAKWRAFANSLRARIAMRMSEVNPSLAKQEVSDALNSLVFTSNAGNAALRFQNEEANANPLYNEFLTQSWTFVSEPFINLMNSYGNGTASSPSDPRINKYAAPNKNGNYEGFPYGLPTSDTFDYEIEDKSLPSELVRSIDFSSYLMTYSELLFIKAEAEQRGWYGNVTDAATTYNSAITASMEQWGVSSGEITSYLSISDVKYNADNWRKLIGEQKYISLYTQGFNSWSEWRRLDYPILSFPEAGKVNAEEIPRRFYYPDSEKSVNKSNLEQAISNMGGDTFSTRIWWDK